MQLQLLQCLHVLHGRACDSVHCSNACVEYQWNTTMYLTPSVQALQPQPHTVHPAAAMPCQSMHCAAAAHTLCVLWLRMHVPLVAGWRPCLLMHLLPCLCARGVCVSYCMYLSASHCFNKSLSHTPLLSSCPQSAIMTSKAVSPERLPHASMALTTS